MRRQRLAFAWHACRCDHLGGGFLGRAQLGRVGCGQGQTSGAEYGLQVGWRCDWRWRCHRSRSRCWSSHHFGWRRRGVRCGHFWRGNWCCHDWRFDRWRYRCFSSRCWRNWLFGDRRCDHWRWSNHFNRRSKLFNWRGDRCDRGFHDRGGFGGDRSGVVDDRCRRCHCCDCFSGFDNCRLRCNGHLRGWNNFWRHVGFRCWCSGCFNGWCRVGFRCGGLDWLGCCWRHYRRCRRRRGHCSSCGGGYGRVIVLGEVLFAIGAFIAFACFVVLAFAVTVATVTVAAATTTTTTWLIAFACRILRFAVRTGAWHGFQDAGGLDFRTRGWHGNVQRQFFHLGVDRGLVGTRLARWARRTFGALATFCPVGAFRTLRTLAAFSTVTRWLAFGHDAVARLAWFTAFTGFAWWTWWTDWAAGVGSLGLVGDRTRCARLALFALGTAILAGTAAAAWATGGVAVAATVRRRRQRRKVSLPSCSAS